jgi:predicted MPP superfamily phosphohydrolase
MKLLRRNVSPTSRTFPIQGIIFGACPIIVFFLGSLNADTLSGARLFFISDMQSPLVSEAIFLKPFKNREARDSLFADVMRQNPTTLFMLGDLTAEGARDKAWVPLDTFIQSLGSLKTALYAIPGNHEYWATASRGRKNFLKRFPEEWLHGFCVKTDSLAIVLVNSNFDKLNKSEASRQLYWYSAVMDSLDHDSAIRAIIVCTHHAPFSNSKIVGCNREVEKSIVPQFKKSLKAVLFLSGHSHNLEYFSRGKRKHFLVIGGGGGVAQPLFTGSDSKFHDLIPQERKPVYFYVIVQRDGKTLRVSARGLTKDLKFMILDFDLIDISDDQSKDSEAAE